MDYRVVLTAEAEEDLNQFIQYLLFAKKNEQAAKNVLDDFEKNMDYKAVVTAETEENLRDGMVKDISLVTNTVNNSEL